MNKIEKTSESKNHTAINIGKFSDLTDYAYIHPIKDEIIDGRLFLKEHTKMSGTEISFNLLPPKTEKNYFHVHRKNEETYIFFSGSGFFQVDDDCFDIKEGSIIRVSPQGRRGLCNTSEDEMLYIVIQSKENSLEEYTTNDGQRVPFTPKWEMGK